jgi:predicted DNA binding CopG/RHH family protein
MKTLRHKRDDQVHEFEKGDLGKDIERSRSAVVIRPKKRSLPTSILLDSSLIGKLKEKAEDRGIGYQTMLKIILHEHVDDY